MGDPQWVTINWVTINWVTINWVTINWVTINWVTVTVPVSVRALGAHQVVIAVR